MAAVSQTVPNHVGSIPDAVRITLEEYGLDQLQSGDLITCNDYFRVGTHLNDVVFIRPLIINGELLGALTLRCHQMDLGGIAPGGFQVLKRDRYEDGLAIPPMKLFARGKPVPEVVKVFMGNTRAGALIYNEMHTVYACLRMGETLIEDSIAKYGKDAYLGAIRYTDDVSAETMRVALETLPDGVYEGEEILDTDFLPNSPQYRIKMRINKRGGRAEVDLSGSSVAACSAMNSAWPMLVRNHNGPEVSHRPLQPLHLRFDAADRCASTSELDYQSRLSPRLPVLLRDCHLNDLCRVQHAKPCPRR